MTSRKQDKTVTSIIISAAIGRLAPQKTQRELARAMGFARPNMLSMLKTGDTRVPFTKIPIIAGSRAIDADLLRDIPDQEQAFGWYGPDRYAWFLERPEVFSVPVPGRGAQGLWEWIAP